SGFRARRVFRGGSGGAGRGNRGGGCGCRGGSESESSGVAAAAVRAAAATGVAVGDGAGREAGRVDGGATAAVARHLAAKRAAGGGLRGLGRPEQAHAVRLEAEVRPRGSGRADGSAAG